MTRNGCEAFGEICAIVSAGAATREEERALKTHTAGGCSPCTAYLRLLGETTAILIDALPLQQPPPAVKQRLLDRIEQENMQAQIIQTQVRRALPHTGFSWFGAIGWGFASLLAVALAGDHYRSEHKLSQVEEAMQQIRGTVAEQEETIALMKARQTHLVAMQGAEPSPASAAKLFWNVQANAGFLVTFDLPALPPNKVYQLWAIAEAVPPIDAGIFALDAQGIGTLKMKPLPHLQQNVQLFAITIEPDGGSPGPTGAVYLKGEVAPGPSPVSSEG